MTAFFSLCFKKSPAIWIIGLFLTQSLLAQCPGCAINFSCSVPGGGLCPDSLPGGTVGTPYSQDVTFYIPPTIDAAPFSGGLLGVVPLVEMRIDAISGLPFGLNWSCNVPGNGCTYFPSASDTMGCVKICGTPVGNPGVYNLTIFVTATVAAGVFGNQTAQTTFASQMVLFPDTASNQGFSMAPGLGCAPLQVSFQNNFPSNGYQPIPGQTSGYQYLWNFGNGLQSNVENPPNVLYNSAGNFPVTYQVTVDTFGFQLTNVTLTAVACTDFFTAGNPDLYIRVFDGSNNQVFTNQSSSNAANLPQSINLSINANNPPYRIEVWDDDSGTLGTADDNCFDGGESPHPTVPLNLPPVNSLGSTTQFFVGSNTSLAFNYTFTKNALQVAVTDTVVVLPRPPEQPVMVSPSNFVCSPDSIMLSVQSGYGYEWFLNDTSLVVGATTSSVWIKQSGRYKVRMFDINTGCDAFSFDTTITIGAGIPSNFAIVQNGSDLGANISGNYTYQWKFFNGATFIPIPAPTGTAASYTPPAGGQYALEITSPDGCSAQATFTFNLSEEMLASPMSEVTIFPNPVQGSAFQIKLGEKASGAGNYRLLDMAGRVLAMETFEVTQSQTILPVSVQGLPSGIYSLILEWDGDGKAYKIILP
jgi:hypothetical protein